MTITTGCVETFEQAITLAFREAQVKGMAPGVAHLLAPTVERQAFQTEVEKLAAAAVKSRYGKDVRWGIDWWWLVPVPSPRYEARGLPSLVIETRVYIVASIRIVPQHSRRWWLATVVDPVGKPQITLLPLSFVQAVLDGEDDDRYRVVARDGLWISLEVAGLKQPLRLNREFINRLRQVLQLKSVADWLDDFGYHGRSIAPMVVGALLGLIYRREGEALERQPVLSRETLVGIITSLGYSAARAERVLERSEPDLRADMTLEEATRVLLRHIGEEV